MRCHHCTATTDNGLNLCERCQIAATVYLEFLPIYFRNLTRWRPGRAGSRPVPGSREPITLGITPNDPVSNALDEAGATILEFANRLTTIDGHDEAHAVHNACRTLTEQLTTVSARAWAGEFMETAAELEHTLRTLTLRVAPGWYAGGCHQCASSTYVIPGLTWVTCGGCGVTTYARDHIATILDEARGWVARPRQIAWTLVALTDETSGDKMYDRIRKWASLGLLDPVRRIDPDGDPTGPKMYRLGDVMDLRARMQDAA